MSKPRKRRQKPILSVSDPARFSGVKSLPDIDASRGPKTRHPSHLVEQKLKFNDPSKTRTQLDLFEHLQPDTIGDVKQYEIKYEGIRLTTPEDRLLNALFALLREKSENKNTKSPDFYQGNYDPGEAIAIYGGERVRPVHMQITPSELYKAYLGNEKYSGKEITDIQKTLRSLEQKRFLMKYDRKRQVKVRGRWENRTDRVEAVRPLISVVDSTWDMTDQEVARLDKGDETIRQKKGRLIIALNPILTDQIQSKYVEYPSDINRRTMIAAGGHPNTVTPAINALRDRLFHVRSNKQTTWEINADKLPYSLHLDDLIKQGRKKRVQERIQDAIQACKNLGILLDAQLTQGAEGQMKYVFTLNPDFE